MAERKVRGRGPAVMALLACVVGASLGHAARRHYEVLEFLYPAFRVGLWAAACGSALASVSALRRKDRWMTAWVAGGALLLVVRCTFPFMPPWFYDCRFEGLDAYGGPWGVCLWALIHALGCLSAGRLFQHRARIPGILHGGFWTLAIIFYLGNDEFGGDDLFFRWRT